MHDRFAAAIAALGPFEPSPLLAVAVSGGADSLALALLADGWARERGGLVMAFVVDHGLRPESAAEAAVTVSRLATRSIAARLLQLSDLPHGSALAERARKARYRALVAACAAAGCLHLLLGHHRADQTETVMMRALAGSRSFGLAAMPALRELESVRLLRPLLGMAPADLRAMLRAEGVAWVEDPSNRDRRALRARLRADDRSGAADLASAAARAGESRAQAEQRAAAILAERVVLRPEGFALLSPGRLPADALSALLQTLGGSEFPPAPAAVEALAAAPSPATLGGVQVLPAGRLGPGWLLVREASAMAAGVPATPGTVWDNRFRLHGEVPEGLLLGALGPDATQFRSRSGLPHAVLQTLPALRLGNSLVAVPHLRYGQISICARTKLRFHPPRPMTGAPFWSNRSGEARTFVGVGVRERFGHPMFM